MDSCYSIGEALKNKMYIRGLGSRYSHVEALLFWKFVCGETLYGWVELLQDV